MRPFGVAGDLRLLPRRQFRIGVAQQLVGLGLEPGDLGVDIDGAIGGGFAQFVDPALQLGDRLFEIEEACHGRVG